MGNKDKAFRMVLAAIISRPSILQKFAVVTVDRGQTVWPKSPAELENKGVRFDYDGIVTKEDGVDYNKFNLQLNAGDIPAPLKRLREQNKGTHAVIGVMYLPHGVELDGEGFTTGFDEALEKGGHK
jgi:hypothetical protein